MKIYLYNNILGEYNKIDIETLNNLAENYKVIVDSVSDFTLCVYIEKGIN